VSRRFLDEGRVRGIRISTRPDYIDEKRLLMLKSFGVTTVELGVQSLDDKVLKASRRGHSIEDVIRASNLIKYHRMKLGLQMMVGLPGDTYQKTYQTAQKILRLKPDYVRIYPTLVLKDTELCRLYQRGEYQPLDLETAVEYTGDLLQLFYQSGIKVIRVGLHPTELLIGGDELVAGPFHPAFRSLVESRMYRLSIEEHLAAFKDESIRIRVNSRDRSNLMGNKRENIRYFNQNFPKVRFEIDSGDDVSRYHYEILGKDFKAVYTIF